jgi:uncharacterized protein YdaU (DUF1376 family)
MHHYPFHVGDYRKDTANLSLLEHGVYRTLIDCYYTQETPLPSDKARLCRMIGARSDVEVLAVSNIIDDYFTLTDCGYIQNGCDKVLSKIYEKSEKARMSVEKRWDKRAKSIRNEYEQDTNVSENDTNVQKNDTIDILPNTQHPTPNIITSTNVDKIDYRGIVDTYHRVLPMLQPVKLITDKRKSSIRSCCAIKSTFSSLEFWDAYFESIKSSRWHMGENKDGWKADLDYLIKKTNFVKMYERGCSL